MGPPPGAGGFGYAGGRGAAGFGYGKEEFWMMTVKQVSQLTGLTVRTLQYYDKIGLMPCADYTEAGYRLYDEEALDRLQQIMLFKELGFQLKEIKEILDKEDFDIQTALTQQINLLTMKREHIGRVIKLAKQMKEGEGRMKFDVFDTSKMDDYAQRAKERWGASKAYEEFSEKSKGRSEQMQRDMAEEMMGFFAEFGDFRSRAAAADAADVQALVARLQKHITDNYYNCTNEILAGLGMMYVHDPEFRSNIDRVGGAGTAAFVGEAIMIFCK